MPVTVTRATIACEAAHAAVAAAVAKANDLAIRINAAVVDRGGNLMAFLRMEDAFLHSIGIAIDKAYTSAGFGMATRLWRGELPQGSLLREGIQHRPRLVVFGGGLPIEIDGQVVGGIGVSGGSEEQDEACARAGIEAIQELPRQAR